MIIETTKDLTTLLKMREVTLIHMGCLEDVEGYADLKHELTRIESRIRELITDEP